MKFVVRHDVFNEVEVKLHWETKDKIKKIALGLGVLAAASAVVAYSYYTKDVKTINTK